MVVSYAVNFKSIYFVYHALKIVEIMEKFQMEYEKKLKYFLLQVRNSVMYVFTDATSKDCARFSSTISRNLVYLVRTKFLY